MDDAVREVKERLDIVEIVRRYVDLRPVSGRWMGPCPFHQETKPSFSVNGEEGFFYCFGCQAAGDVISFYQRINGLEFREALEQLASEAGVQLRGHRPDPRAAEKKAEKKAFLDMHDLAAEYYRTNLGHAAGARASEYLRKRGTTSEIIENFGLGFSLNEWNGLDNLFRSRGFNREQGTASGLLTQNEKGNVYDRFRGRLMFPIKSLAGRVVAFGGRIIVQDDDAPKYINSSDSPIYIKGEHLYGLQQARTHINRSKRALLTEGYMDVLTLHQFGFQDSCGVLGTALTPEQVRRLSGFCSTVDLVFDGDAAGRKAALRSSEMILHAGLKCRVVSLPEGEDVDSLLQAKGREGFEQCLDNAQDGLMFCLSTVKNDFSPKEIMDWAGGFLKKLRDPSLQAWYIPRIAEGLGVTEHEMRTTIGAAAARGRTRNASSRQNRTQPASPAPRGVEMGGDVSVDKYFLRFVAQYPDAAGALAEQGLGEVMSTEWGRRFWAAVMSVQPADIFTVLDDEQKSFWARWKLEPVIDDDKLEGEWNHIVGMIQEKRLVSEHERLKHNLREAQASGDNVSMMAILADLKVVKEKITSMRSARES